MRADVIYPAPQFLSLASKILDQFLFLAQRFRRVRAGLFRRLKLKQTPFRLFLLRFHIRHALVAGLQPGLQVRNLLLGRGAGFGFPLEPGFNIRPRFLLFLYLFLHLAGRARLALGFRKALSRVINPRLEPRNLLFDLRASLGLGLELCIERLRSFLLALELRPGGIQRRRRLGRRRYLSINFGKRRIQADRLALGGKARLLSGFKLLRVLPGLLLGLGSHGYRILRRLQLILEPAERFLYRGRPALEVRHRAGHIPGGRAHGGDENKRKRESYGNIRCKKADLHGDSPRWLFHSISTGRPGRTKPAAPLNLPGIFACLRAFKNSGPHKR